MNATEQTEYLTAPEVGELLRVGHDKILALIHSGELPAADMSLNRGQRPRWRISRVDLELFLAGRRNTPKPQVIRRRKRNGVKQYV